MNKIKYNLKNVHVAPLYEESDGTFSYGTPRSIPGAVSLSLDAEGETEPFYADGIVYFRSTSNNGYSGDLEMALVPDWFHEQFLNEIKDENGVLVESANITSPKYFAMLFEFDGDANGIRHVMYKCNASRPSVSSQTKEASISPVTETLSLTCDPMATGLTKAKSGDDVDTTTYRNWYQSVYIPALTDEQLNGGGGTAALTGLTISGVTLDPTFAAGTTSYTGEASGETGTITATGDTGVNFAVTINGSSIANGGSATWATGTNVVKVTASKAGCTSTTYTVTVTKS